MPGDFLENIEQIALPGLQGRFRSLTAFAALPEGRVTPCQIHAQASCGAGRGSISATTFISRYCASSPCAGIGRPGARCNWLRSGRKCMAVTVVSDTPCPPNNGGARFGADAGRSAEP